MTLIIHEMGRGWVYLDHDQCAYVPSYTIAAQYAAGLVQPRYPVPSLIGVVEYHDYQDALEITITDCDERYDPRLCYAVMRPDGFVIDDYPHDSPNYR